MRPFTDRIDGAITEAARSAGFEPFGNRDSWTLVFRSATAVLTITWDRGYFRAECEPRTTSSAAAIDDDLFRQLVDRESPDPYGARREWTDYEAFVVFLRTRLTEFAQIATIQDTDLRAQLNALNRQRAERAQAWWDSHKAPHTTRTAAALPVPSRFWANAAPIIAVVLGIVVMATLVLLDDRYPGRGFEGALGAAFVAVPIVVAIVFLIARDWRHRLRDARDEPGRSNSTV